jgi:hypothetical protein
VSPEHPIGDHQQRFQTNHLSSKFDQKGLAFLYTLKGFFFLIQLKNYTAFSDIFLKN